ncbi:MAG: SDR family NAD(P)-dependent oxidoreductase [Rhizobiales bacterium]|nr:SDR family NAD(P)-dependent oxidoreductase [Hyphomicrobiales bacterium]MBO6700149.1 SDR family NAD(P)-dependent oxidoreductase [Hyphomicrobiales bacterium]MBO6737686.1 SDR family NAD(P)-dependent oxidoreductase [Hyphomicrobiales bacterium]MBO6913257.1 SDR family NAD(P)-dependent oxidoreductase [Hyphomicrobiales bacterium]MBO6954301.1 SDR family NAD(P)-dependent oxidoreductase [Hyphomicrobiales bacterium]
MNRTALVTGANRGIGKAITQGLASLGLNVVLAGRDGATLGELAIGLHQRHGVETRSLTLNVADPVSIEQGLAKLERNQVTIDVLVNNAGILPDGDMLTMPWEDIEASTRVNALGPLQLMRLLMPGMAARGYGRVVNVSSGWGSLNGLGPGAYGITKAFLNAITIKGAREAGRGVLVNAMCPGWVRTDMGGAGANRTPEEGAETALFLATLPDGAPSGRIFRDRQPIPWDE